MTRLTIGGRLACAVLGAIVGSVVGFFVAWILGLYSHRHISPLLEVDLKSWILYSALGFGLMGFVLGPHVGTVLGGIISGIFELERSDSPSMPGWLVVVLVIAIVMAVWWWM